VSIRASERAVNNPDSGFFGGSTIPLLSAFVLALAFLGVVVAIGLSDTSDATPAAASTSTTEEGVPQGDIPTPRVTLTLDTAGEGKGTVRVAGQPRTCTGECRFRIDQDTSVTIIARAAEGSVFVSWTGSCGGGRICTITMDQARRATALFTRPQPDSESAPVPPAADCADELDNDDDGYIDDADVECFTGNSEAGDDADEPQLPGGTTPPVAPIAPPPVMPPPPPPPPPPFVAPPPPPVDIPPDIEPPPPAPAVPDP
jgi:hypothetical protein